MNGVSHALKDIRPMANERARKRAEEAQGTPAERPPGNGFMTERAKAKEALRAEVNTYKGENVIAYGSYADNSEAYAQLQQLIADGSIQSGWIMQVK